MKKKINRISIVACLLLIIGISCILVKAFSKEYIDSAGILHEHFSLLPIGFLNIFCSFILFIIGKNKH
jgi:uncharacterized membrane protein (DUF485 family)